MKSNKIVKDLMKKSFKWYTLYNHAKNYQYCEELKMFKVQVRVFYNVELINMFSKKFNRS